MKLKKENEIEPHNDSVYMTLKSKIVEFDKPTPKGYVYTKECMEKAINADLVQENLERKLLMGEFFSIDNGPEDISILKMENISHNLRDLEIQSDGLYGSIDILKTEYGRMAQDMIKDSKDIRIYPRGIGELLDDNKTINPETYELISFDLWDYSLLENLK